MDAAGVLDERYNEMDDIARARRVPSLQLAGTPDRSTLDINALTDIGVNLLAASVVSANTVRRSFLDHYATCVRFLISRWEDCSTNSTNGPRKTASMTRPARQRRLPPTRVEPAPPLDMDLTTGDVKAIIWATGYRARLLLA